MVEYFVGGRDGLGVEALEQHSTRGDHHVSNEPVVEGSALLGEMHAFRSPIRRVRSSSDEPSVLELTNHSRQVGAVLQRLVRQLGLGLAVTPCQLVEEEELLRGEGESSTIGYAQELTS